MLLYLCCKNLVSTAQMIDNHKGMKQNDGKYELLCISVHMEDETPRFKIIQLVRDETPNMKGLDVIFASN